MPPSRALFTSQRGDWRTPTDLFMALDAEWHFTLDPAPVDYGEDGLLRSWKGERVFCNPPYGRHLSRWLAKCHEPIVAVFLLPARTDTSWWHDHCLQATEIRFLRGRLRFDDGKGRATFPSAVVIFDNEKIS